MSQFAAAGALYLFVTLMFSCSTQPSHFYTLTGAGGERRITSEVFVAVGPVSIPAIVDRPQIVVTTGPNQVRLEEFNRWALPLQNNIARVIADNLATQLGSPRITVFPESTSLDADYRAMIDVQRFDSAPGDAATLEAVWTVRRMKDGRSEQGRTMVRQSAPDKDYGALAAAHSQAMAQLSREIADAVRALARSDKF